MKTYAIFPTKKISFCVDGVAKEFTPEDQIGVVSVDGVSLRDLLGAIQFHHCQPVEIDEAEILRIHDDEGDIEVEVLVEEVDGDGDGADSSSDQLDDSTTLDDQPGEGDDNGEVDSDLDDTAEFEVPAKVESTQPESTAATAKITDRESIVHQFIADGIDERVATTLADQSIAPDDVRQLIIEGFDLTELEGVGKKPAAALMVAYGPKLETTVEPAVEPTPTAPQPEQPPAPEPVTKPAE